MGNEHFWQVPRAQGVYARSITRHARRERSARVLPADEPGLGLHALRVHEVFVDDPLPMFRCPDGALRGAERVFPDHLITCSF